MTDEVLARLLPGEPVSGEAISRELGVTRAAVWKQIESLRGMGFEIESRGKGGYILKGCPDSLMGAVVRRGLKTKWAGCEIRWFPTIGSTNREARRLAAEGAPHGLTVLADEQTAGRGRRGRSWETPRGDAIALSIVLRPQAHPSQVALLSLSVAWAAAAAFEETAGARARIKWPNDGVCGGRKVAGILLEMDADEQTVHSVVAGIGINVHQQSFPPEIAETAGSLDQTAGRRLSRAEIVRGFLTRLEEAEEMRADGRLMDAYRARSATLGQPVRVIAPAEEYTGVAREITPGGALIVETDAGLREVLAGDVSVRGLMGYA